MSLFKSKKEKLLDALREVLVIFQKYEVKIWYEHLSPYIISIENDERGTAEKLLKEFGGMGSFSDLVLSHLNGHSITEEEEKSANSKLDKLRQRIYILAKRIAN